MQEVGGAGQEEGGEARAVGRRVDRAEGRGRTRSRAGRSSLVAAAAGRSSAQSRFRAVMSIVP